MGQQLRQGSSTYVGAAWVLRCCTAVASGCAAKACDYCRFTAAAAAAAHHPGGRLRRGAAWLPCRRCSGGGRRPWWGCPTGRRPASSGPPWPPTCRRLAGLPLPAAAGPTAATAPAVGLLHRVQHGRWGTRTARRGMFTGAQAPKQPTQFLRRRQLGPADPCRQNPAALAPGASACDQDSSSLLASTQEARQAVAFPQSPVAQPPVSVGRGCNAAGHFYQHFGPP